MKSFNYIIVIIFISIQLSQFTSAQNSSIGSYIFSAGYVYKSSGTTSLEIFVGQNAIGEVYSDANTANIGFLYNSKHTTGIDDSQISHNNILHSISPNPLTVEGKLDFSLSNNGHIKLQIINVLCEIAMTLDIGYLNKGSHSRVIHFDRLFDGLYFYKIYDDNSFSIGSFIVIK
jgi:hypothetical protein